MAQGLNKQDSSLRQRIVKLVLNHRDSASIITAGGIRFSSSDVYFESGVPLKRRTIILLSGGCSIPTCTMCPFTNYNLYGSGVLPPDFALQITKEFEKSPPDGVELLSIYNDGSFFADAEISRDERVRIARVIAENTIPKIMVESLPQFINFDDVKEFLDTSGCELTIGIGLQSADDYVRQVCTGASFSRRQFEKAVDAAFRLGVRIKAYLMIKPPFLDESTAYLDVLASCHYLQSLGVASATLCPTRVADHTLVNRMYAAGFYKPPHPYTILATLRSAIGVIEPRVALVNLTAHDFEAVTSTSSRSTVATSVLTVLKAFDSSNKPEALELPEPLKREFDKHCDYLKRGSTRDLRVTTAAIVRRLEEAL